MSGFADLARAHLQLVDTAEHAKRVQFWLGFSTAWVGISIGEEKWVHMIVGALGFVLVEVFDRRGKRRLREKYIDLEKARPSPT